MSAPTVPFDLPSEEAALGSILRDPAAIERVDGELAPERFYLERHGWIYAAMRACYQRRVPPDLATVAAELRTHPAPTPDAPDATRLEAIGGYGWLQELQRRVPHAARVAHYAAAVVATWRRRQIIEAGGRIAAIGFDEQLPLDEAAERAEQALYGATRAADDVEAGFVSLAEAVRDRSAEYTAVLEGERDAPGVRTGLDELDALLGGLKPGQLVTIGARPSIGKSALMQSIARHIARHGGHVGIFSLEMGRDEIVDRFCAQETGMALDDITNYRIGGGGVGRLYDAFGVVSDWPVSIDDTAGLTITAIRARARRLHRQRPLVCLFVDYLQLVGWAPHERSENDAITTISRGLKSLAKELHIPVVALAQLNREVEKRANPVPVLSDFRGSGTIEQDSDVVIFPVRPVLHQPDADPRLVELHIAKQRQGRVGIARCHFDGPRTLHVNLPSSYRIVEGYDHAA